MARDLKDLVTESFGIIDRAIAEYKPTVIISLFSGGHDSYCATHVSSYHPDINSPGASVSCRPAVVTIDTGIGIPATRQFVKNRCDAHGWNLWVYSAKECGQVYRDMVVEHGFPGPPMHYKMYQRLKERPLRRMIRDMKTGRRDHIMLISGCRQEESVRRMGNVQEMQHEGVRVWCSPLAHWTEEDVRNYMVAKSLPRNPVKDILGLSGECLCGCFAKAGERDLIEKHFPDADTEILRIERDAAKAGVRCRWGVKNGWGESNPKKLTKMAMCTSCTAATGSATEVDRSNPKIATMIAESEREYQRELEEV